MFALNWLTGFREEDFWVHVPPDEKTCGHAVSKLCHVTPTSIQDGHHQQTYF
jgi:hypothetical protein